MVRLGAARDATGHGPLGGLRATRLPGPGRSCRPRPPDQVEREVPQPARVVGVEGVRGDAEPPWRGDHDYDNFIETPADAGAACPRASYERLREVKAVYDPDELIVSAHPVRPAG